MPRQLAALQSSSYVDQAKASRADLVFPRKQLAGQCQTDRRRDRSGFPKVMRRAHQPAKIEQGKM